MLNALFGRVSLVLIAALILAGCSAPTQKVAMQAEEIKNQQMTTVVNDLANIGKQQAVDRGVSDARTAAAKNDPEEAQAALEKAVNTFEKITWLEKQAIKARFGPGGIVDQYIWGTQGIFDILYNDWKKAEQKVDEAAATQPE